eukprot:scaffold308138_cov41-Attheya_sp.AAC.1
MAYVNKPPTAEDFERVFSEDTGEFPIDVLTLTNADDFEGDVSVTDVTWLSGDKNGIDISDLENWIVDTDYYDLPPEVTEVVIYTIQIEDEEGQTVQVTGTIKIVGVSEPPLFETVYEDTGVFTLNITDPVTSISIISGNGTGVELVDDEVTIDTDLYELPKDDTIQIVYQICYDVSCDETTVLTIT